MAQQSNFSDFSNIAHHKSQINLLRGWPHPSLLPVPDLKKATASVLASPEITTPGLEYGPDAGHPPLRSAVAEWLSSFYQPAEPIQMERISITGGASQNMGSLFSVYTDPVYTRNVWCIAPAYMLAFRIFEDAGFAEKMRSVPEDDDGCDIEFLEREIARSEEKAMREGNTEPVFKRGRPWAKVYKHIIYAVPSYANPSSKTMPLSRREALVRLARRFDALVICDDVYDFLQWPADLEGSSSTLSNAVEPRLVDIDRFLDGGAEREGSDGFGNVCSNGSFSKITAPGLRTGWTEATEKFRAALSQVGTTRSGGAPSQFTSTYVADLLTSGELHDRILRVLQPTYARRQRTMLRAIKQHLEPLGIELPQSDRRYAGGYFIWISLPSSLDADEVATRAREDENIIVAPGSLFEVPNDLQGHKFPHGVRLSFSWEDEEKISEGIERLGVVMQGLLQKAGSDHVPGNNADQASSDIPEEFR